MNSDSEIKKAIRQERMKIIQKIKDEFGKDWYADVSETWLYSTSIRVKMPDGSTKPANVFLPYDRRIQLALNYWDFQKTPSMNIRIKDVDYEIVNLGNGKYKQYRKDYDVEMRKTHYRSVIVKSVLDF